MLYGDAILNLETNPDCKVAFSSNRTSGTELSGLLHFRINQFDKKPNPSAISNKTY